MIAHTRDSKVGYARMYKKKGGARQGIYLLFTFPRSVRRKAGFRVLRMLGLGV